MAKYVLLRTNGGVRAPAPAPGRHRSNSQQVVAVCMLVSLQVTRNGPLEAAISFCGTMAACVGGERRLEDAA